MQQQDDGPNFSQGSPSPVFKRTNLCLKASSLAATLRDQMRALLHRGCAVFFARGPSQAVTRASQRRPAFGWSRMHASGTSPASATKEEHNATEAEYFAQVLPLMQASITPEIQEKLQQVADSVPGLSSTSRVLDAGCGDGVLIPHLQARQL